jgi:hypothetical protein
MINYTEEELIKGFIHVIQCHGQKINDHACLCVRTYTCLDYHCEFYKLVEGEWVTNLFMEGWDGDFRMFIGMDNEFKICKYNKDGTEKIIHEVPKVLITSLVELKQYFFKEEFDKLELTVLEIETNEEKWINDPEKMRLIDSLNSIKPTIDECKCGNEVELWGLCEDCGKIIKPKHIK